MDNVSGAGNGISSFIQQANERSVQQRNALDVRKEVQHARGEQQSRRARDDEAAERARQRRAEQAPEKTGGRLDTYA